MKPRKNEHTEFVSEYKGYENCWCRLSGQDCWFKQKKETIEYQSENSDNKFFEMMVR